MKVTNIPCRGTGHHNQGHREMEACPGNVRHLRPQVTCSSWNTSPKALESAQIFPAPSFLQEPE